MLPLLLIAGLWSACSSNKTSNQKQKVIDEIEVLESKLDKAAAELDLEVEDMNPDVDSLL
ncbi:MAG: hypothetical protein ACI80H_001311 [Pseudoalteromonas distincta]|jgi:hypothetical protein